MSQRPLCRRCLLKDLDEEYFRSIYQYIENLPWEERASQSVYAGRLALCRTCESLQNGMCIQCGCFVEVRAAKRRLSCPADRWKAEAPLLEEKQRTSPNFR